MINLKEHLAPKPQWLINLYQFILYNLHKFELLYYDLNIS